MKVWQLYTGRFLLGLGAGLEITISPVYIHEICRPVVRDICGSFPQVIKRVSRVQIPLPSLRLLLISNAGHTLQYLPKKRINILKYV